MFGLPRLLAHCLEHAIGGDVERNPKTMEKDAKTKKLTWKPLEGVEDEGPKRGRAMLMITI